MIRTTVVGNTHRVSRDVRFRSALDALEWSRAAARLSPDDGQFAGCTGLPALAVAALTVSMASTLASHPDQTVGNVGFGSNASIS